jgi:glycerol-3-phosphate acyltransferase PlsX
MATTIALDAMGGDFAPRSEVAGAVEAYNDFGVHTCLVGREDAIRSELKKLKATDEGLTIVHADEVITMSDPPMTPIRKKRKSSVRIAAELVKKGEAHAFVSAGNTGATMACAKLVIGGIDEVERPALAAMVPSAGGGALVLDVGANSDCKPLHLEHFAIMGSVYASQVLKIERPRVALLSIGEEDSKGNELTKEAYKALQKSPLNFVGNVEGNGIFQGEADVIVTDGFTGNVVLKTGESVYEFIASYLREQFRSSLRARLGFLLSKHIFKDLKSKLDYSEYGGAQLLGVIALTIICHGKSEPRAIRNALRLAHDLRESRFNKKIVEQVRSFMKDNPNGNNSVSH